jgi:radical SAM superfamily enzyme YgiQ (UPF0313 family)
MKILMVYCNSMQENALPAGLSQLLGCLKDAEFDIDLFDTTFYRWEEKSAMEVRMEYLQFPPCEIRYKDTDVYEDFNAKINDFKPDLIGFSVVEPTFNFSIKLLESAEAYIKANGVKVAFGGVHAIYYKESLFPHELIDYICISEGENTFIDLCNRLMKGEDVKDVRGFYIRQGREFIENPPAELTDLNKLPFMDFSLFSEEYLLKPMMGKLYRTISVELTRGCPYKCSYCGNSFLTGMFKEYGHWYRLKSIDRIYEEYKEYTRLYKPEFIYKHSESFLAVNKDRLHEYMDMYSEFNIPYWIETRPEDVTEEKADLLVKTNCKRISIGLENGNQKYRKERLKRNYTNEQVIRASDILHDKGISFSMNLILGLPFETRDMIFDGINLLRRCKPASTSIFLFTPYKGNELRKVCEENNMVPESFIGGDYFQTEYSLKGNTLSESEVVGLYKTLPMYVHLPESDFDMLAIAEKDTSEGRYTYNKLKEKFKAQLGW